MRCKGTVLGALVFVLAAPASALATTTTVFAAPRGSGTTCSQAAPCSLPTAITQGEAVGFTNSAVIEVNPGTYGSPSTGISVQLSGTGGGTVTLEGVPGQAMPTIYTDGISSVTPGAAFVGLHLEMRTGGDFAISVLGGSLDRVYAHSAGMFATCNAASGTITNTVCWASGSELAALGLPSYAIGENVGETLTLRNVTAWNSGAGGAGIGYAPTVDNGFTFTQTVDAYNVIAHGTGSGADSDVFASATLNGTATASTTINLTASDFATTGAGTGATIDTTGTSDPSCQKANITTIPTLDSPSTGDFTEQAGSTTVGAGATCGDTGSASLDLFGDPRETTGAVDIGAYEYLTPPAATTGAATAISQSAATLNGTVDPGGAFATYHFEYGTTMSYGSSTPETSAGSGSSAAAESAAISGLAPNTKYYYRIVASNGGGPTPGGDQTFTTPPLLPVVSTGAASDVSASGATLNGSVNPEGTTATYHFDYGTTTAYGASTPETPAGSASAAGAQSTSISGLAPNTTYHYRIVATNSGGVSDGADQTFATPAVPPAAVTGSASAVSTSGATVAGTVDPENAATTYQFDYGTTTAYGSSTVNAPVGSDLSAHTVAQVLSGLASNTTYHFRIVATNGAGTTTGADQTFTTTGSSLARPVLSRLTVKPPHKKGRHRKLKPGSISYTDSTGGRATVTVLRTVPGVKKGKRCVAVHRGHRGHGRKCSAQLTAATFSRADTAGENTITFTTTLGGHRLRRGRYVLEVVASDGAGTSNTVTKKFKIA